MTNAWSVFSVLVLLGFAAGLERTHAEQAALPPLCIEVDSDHPLLVFPFPADDSSSVQAERIVSLWHTLPAPLKPYSAIHLDGASVLGPDARAQHYRSLLEQIQPIEIPVVISVADENPATVLSVEAVERLVNDFACVKAVVVRGFSFDEYYDFGKGAEEGLPPTVRWLVALLDRVPQYGRLVIFRLDGINWPRVMSNAWCRPLYEKMRARSGHTAPVAGYRGPHTTAQLSALFGLWLEGAAGQWGVAAGSDWYVDARYIEPGVFGAPAGPEAMPPPLYRAMILNGAMLGACVYVFDNGEDLWGGRHRRMWDEAIFPTLIEIIEKRLITQFDSALNKVRVAYQLAPSRTALDFHLNLRDIDAVLDQGLLLHGAYGVERPGQVSELIPNSGRHYWIPFVSAYAPQEALQRIPRITQPGIWNSAQKWTEFLDHQYEPDGEGSAFISRVGRGIFVMHTRENAYQEQPFRLPSVPAPVRGIEARRVDGGITLIWPFREGDVAYRIYKRIPPDGFFRRVVDDWSTWTWTDTSFEPNGTAAYSVTALTTEEEPFEGAVNYGEYLALSTVESRIAEEVVVGPLLTVAKSRPVEVSTESKPKDQAWWPGAESLPEASRVIADQIAARIEQWDRAFENEDLEGVLDLYTTDYEDPQGWRFQYVRRAYQWFFERYSACKMARQIRRWELGSGEDPDQVDVVLYCRFSGVALTDPTGRFADRVAYFPRTESGEVRISFTNREGIWRISRTAPALPNFGDILSFSTGPYDGFAPGPDVYKP